MRILSILSIVIGGGIANANTALTDWRTESPINLDSAAFESSEIGPVPIANYVTVALSFLAFDETRKQIDARIGLKLTSRGESHITRTDLERLFISRRGLPINFSAKAFYPHVTIGFVNRDLHIQDGVFKDVSSCKYPVVRTFNAPR